MVSKGDDLMIHYWKRRKCQNCHK